MRRTNLVAKSTLKAKTSLKTRTSLTSDSSSKSVKRTPLLKKTAQQLVKPADAAFSKYIRLRDSEYINGEWWGSCISCERRYLVRTPEDKWTNFVDNGHFVSRGHKIVRFDEENCNLQCLTADSKVRMFNGINKSIASVRVGDKLWAFNESDYSLEKAVVEQVESFMPDTLYEVELEDGSKFFATPDHRVVSNGGWVYIKDMLHNVSAFDILEL